MSTVDDLAIKLFETYAWSGGNPPDCHYDRIAGEQWMAQALEACGVADLIEAAQAVADNIILRDTSHGREIRKALARLGCG